MKTPLLSLALLLLSITTWGYPLAPWEKATLKDHLTEVNAEWNCQPEENLLLSQLPFRFANDRERIRMHLQLVEQTLRARSTEHLSDAQRTNRFRHLAVLRQYWQAGKFPVNNQHAQRQPYFVDDAGTHCAVGYLLAQDDANEIVAAVRQNKNYSYLAALATAFPVLSTWAQENGFTLDELAWIQPGYLPVSRGWDAVGNGGGYDGEVLAMANFQDQWIVMAGQFSEMDGQAANNIIGWNGENWFNFGEGLNGIVYDLDFGRNNELIAVGDFSLYDDPDSKNIAAWNAEEQRWVGLQTGEMDGVIYTVKNIYYTTYIGGEFTRVNGVDSYQNLAYFRYEWQNEASFWGNEEGDFSVDGPVYDLVQNDNYQLLVAGEFSLTAAISSNSDQMLTTDNLAYWDDYDRWVGTLETELPAVKAAALQDGYLYIGDASIGQIDVLDGGLWQQMMGITPVAEQTENPVNGFVEFNNELFAYGNFNYEPFVGDFGQSLAAINQTYAYGLALFNDEIKAATPFQGELFVAGDFTSVDNNQVNGLASSDLLINNVVDPTRPLKVDMWSHRQQVYFKATDLPERAQLSFYNVQGQLLKTLQYDQGNHLDAFPMDYNGAVFCRVNSGGYQQTFKLALFD